MPTSGCSSQHCRLIAYKSEGSPSLPNLRPPCRHKGPEGVPWLLSFSQRFPPPPRHLRSSNAKVSTLLFVSSGPSGSFQAWLWWNWKGWIIKCSENVKLAPGPVFSVISIIPGEHCCLLGWEVLRKREGSPAHLSAEGVPPPGWGTTWVVWRKTSGAAEGPPSLEGVQWEEQRWRGVR